MPIDSRRALTTVVEIPNFSAGDVRPAASAFGSRQASISYQQTCAWVLTSLRVQMAMCTMVGAAMVGAAMVGAAMHMPRKIFNSDSKQNAKE